MRLAPFFCRRRNTEKRRQAPAVRCNKHDRNHSRRKWRIQTTKKIETK